MTANDDNADHSLAAKDPKVQVDEGNALDGIGNLSPPANDPTAYVIRERHSMAMGTTHQLRMIRQHRHDETSGIHGNGIHSPTANDMTAEM